MEQTQNTPIVTGIGVSRGVRRGRVYVISGFETNASFQDGDVLVTRITDPTMVAIMAKSAAIVCDIGSITSHPSIVSREMGIPCVVATGNGTQVLKDGMMVEVDGAKGIVTVVSDDTSILTENEQIDDFLNTFVEAACTMDFSTFDDVCSWDRYDPLIAAPWTKRILKLIDDCRAAGLSPHDVACLFPNTNEIRGNMYFEMFSSHFADISKEDRMKIFRFFRDVLVAWINADPYGKRTDLVHSTEQVKKMSEQVVPATPDIARQLGRLVSACYHAGHALYGDMHPSIVYNNYGPYDVSDTFGSGHTLIVKEFGNIRGKELWDKGETLPCENIRIFCVYKDVPVRIDSVSHIIYDGDTIHGLKWYAFFVDEAFADIGYTEEISAAIEQWAIRIFRQFQSYDLEKRKRLYYHQKAYSYKALHETLGQDWRPSKDILAAAKGKPLFAVGWPKEKEDQRKLLRNMMDPRA